MRAVSGARPTQADRRARSRTALLESAARGLSRFGYANLSLETVASDAGYSRGALYHQFSGKEELTLAVVGWIEETWWAEMLPAIAGVPDPVDALIAVSRAHAVYCRRDIARVRMVLSVEFSSRDDPIGKKVAEAVDRVLSECALLITQARNQEAIPPGPPADALALALIGAVEGLVINLAGQEPFDESLAERAVSGLLGLPPRKPE